MAWSRDVVRATLNIVVNSINLKQTFGNYFEYEDISFHYRDSDVGNCQIN